MPINYEEIFGNKKKRKAESPPAAPPKEEPKGDLVPLDLSLVKPGFLTFETEISKWESQGKTLEVKTEDDRKVAVAIGGESARLLKQIEAKRNEIWRPFLDLRKKLDAFVGGFTDRLERIVGSMKAKERRFMDLQEMARREAEKKAKEELAKIQEQINKDAAAKKIEPIILEKPIILPAPTTARTESGVTSYEVKTWKGAVKEGEEDKVARSLCSPDLKKIRDAVQGGLRHGMPGSEGLNIVEEISQRYRT